MQRPRLGSLFTGTAGLDMAVRAVTGATTAWHCDVDPGVNRLLAHHYPDVPNLGDITAVDWPRVPPVDILCGGSPCQDVSAAGKRGGMTTGTRSNLWVSMRDAIDRLHPRLVVWENVRGAYSAGADSDVERCPGCVGDGPGVHLRALGRVLGDLASLGFDAEWCGVRAADVGAPHERYRVFLVAWPADADGPGLEVGGGVGGDPGPERAPAGRGDPQPVTLLPTPTTADGPSGPGTSGRDGGDNLRTAVTLLATGSVTEPLLPTPVTTDAAGTRNATANRQPGARPAHTGTTLTDALCPPLLPTPTAVPYGNNQSPSAGAAVRPSLDSLAPTLLPTPTARLGDGTSRGASHPARRKELCQKRGGELDEVLIHTVDVDWGRFEPAIRRWEVLTRPAPSPTEQGPRGGQRLNPRFVEWMMNLPDGHVTGVPGLSRNDQLKALGNGVVPAQAEAALRSLLTAMPMPTRVTGAA